MAAAGEPARSSTCRRSSSRPCPRCRAAGRAQARRRRTPVPDDRLRARRGARRRPAGAAPLPATGAGVAASVAVVAALAASRRLRRVSPRRPMTASVDRRTTVRRAARRADAPAPPPRRRRSPGFVVAAVLAVVFFASTVLLAVVAAGLKADKDELVDGRAEVADVAGRFVAAPCSPTTTATPRASAGRPGARPRPPFSEQFEQAVSSWRRPSPAWRPCRCRRSTRCS